MFKEVGISTRKEEKKLQEAVYEVRWDFIFRRSRKRMCRLEGKLKATNPP